MSFDLILVNIVSAFVGALIIINFVRNIVEHVVPKNNRILFIVTFSIINGIGAFFLSPYPYKPILLLVLSIAIIMLFQKCSFIQAFFTFTLFSIGLAVGNVLVPLALTIFIPDLSLELYQKAPWLMLIGNLSANFTAYILLSFVKPLKKYIKIVSHNKFMLVVTAVTFAVICSSSALYFYLQSFSLTAYLIIAAVSLSYCIFIVIMWINTLRKTISDEDLSQQKFYNESLRSTLFDLRRFKHDWINNLTVINSMLKMDKITELRQYISELIAQNSEHASTEIFNLKNAGLFGIISSKINQAREKGVTVDLSIIGEIENIPGVKISELCEIIGIFLDNAIEEACKSTKSIGLKMQNANSYIEISIFNNCENKPDLQMITKEGYSTKGDGRGMGLAITKRIIEKNRNILHITSYEDNIFTQTIEILKRKG
ncbi:MAG TPA: GHKL domain-containing protein [Clostridia bacterium]|nr:GHKL domain-containing protein [Clostridia bacterium]